MIVMDFVDRKAELEALENAYSGSKSAMVTLYGRRRIGKTDLIAHFTRNKERSVYYMATKEDSRKQLKMISSQIGIALGDEELTRFGAIDWEALFLRISRRKFKKKLTITIDEFPYIAVSDKAITSIFQKGWDVYLKDSNVMLILCGSSISMMHSEILDYTAPLYHRSTSILEIMPLDIHYALALNAHMNFEERLRLYFIFGGIPAYYAYTEKCRTIIEAIREIFRIGSIFLNEPSVILSEETRKEARYIDILELISGGVNRTNEIASKLGMPSSNLVRYLDMLERIGIIRRTFPIIDIQNRRSKRGVYEIKDNYIYFWFRHVKRNLGNISMESAEKVAAELKDVEELAFENFSAELVRYLSGKRFPRLSKIGRWWGNDPAKPAGGNREEIDIVGFNEDTNDIFFAECKWSNSKTDIGVYNELKRKARLVEWRNAVRKEHFAIFSRSGFTRALDDAAKDGNVELFSLKEIEKELG